MANAFLRHPPHALPDGEIERRPHPHVETAPDKSQAQRFARHFGQLDANPANDAFARLKDEAAALELLIEAAALRPESVGVNAIDLRVVLEQAVARGPAVA